VVEIQQRLPNARIVYASATGMLSVIIPSVGLCVCVSVCLSATTITKRIVEGFVTNFMGRFLGGKGIPSLCFVMMGRGMWK